MAVDFMTKSPQFNGQAGVKLTTLDRPTDRLPVLPTENGIQNVYM